MKVSDRSAILATTPITGCDSSVIFLRLRSASWRVGELASWAAVPSTLTQVKAGSPHMKVGPPQMMSGRWSNTENVVMATLRYRPFQ